MSYVISKILRNFLRHSKFDPYLHSLKFLSISDTNYVNYKRVASGWLLLGHPVIRINPLIVFCVDNVAFTYQERRDFFK